MGRRAALIQSHRRDHLRMGGFARLGLATRARFAFCHRRAIYLGTFHFPNLCCLLRIESDLGSLHPRSEAMANWHFLAVDNSDLARCSGNRFRASLIKVGEQI